MVNVENSPLYFCINCSKIFFFSLSPSLATGVYLIQSFQCIPLTCIALSCIVLMCIALTCPAVACVSVPCCQSVFCKVVEPVACRCRRGRWRTPAVHTTPQPQPCRRHKVGLCYIYWKNKLGQKSSATAFSIISHLMKKACLTKSMICTCLLVCQLN